MHHYNDSQKEKEIKFMKKRLIGLTILAAMMVLACAGCAGEPSANHKPDVDGQSSSQPEVSTAANENAPDSSDPATTDTKNPVILTIDGEDYTFPMSFADFSAKGWEYYDPSVGDAWDYEVQAGLYDWRYFSKDDIKAMMVCVANPTDSALTFSQCNVIGISVDYDRMIDMLDAREVVSIPTGSIQINGLGIGEATQKDFAEEFGKATFRDATDGTYRNGGETYDPTDSDMLSVNYDENAVMSEFQYILLSSAYMK